MVETSETPAAALEHFDRTFKTNARGVYLTVQKGLRLLSDGASIIPTGSRIWKHMPIYGTYGAAKGRHSLVRSNLGGRVVAKRNPVNLISPGPIETTIFDGQFSTKQAADPG